MSAKSERAARRKADMAEQSKKDRARVCGATTRNGGVCSHQAGKGTDHPGRGRCKWHAGSTRSGKMTAAREELNGMAVALEVTPGQAMGAVMNLAAGQLLYATHKVGELDDDELYIEGDEKDSGAFEMLPHFWLSLQRNVMHDLARYAKIAADAGIAERQTSLQESQTEKMAELIEAVMGELELNKKQRAALGPAIRQHLTLVEGEAA